MSNAKPTLIQVQVSDLEKIPGWILSQDGLKITKEFKFKGFEEAFKFMTACYPIIEEMNHHPDWFNCYSLVKVHLTTHDLGGVSPKDIELAKAMNQVFDRQKNLG
ncbi:4a-hydroxytetrahydrobiopterin dehydratase [Polynucleobacter sp. 30F-ANTBAC]|jgi:4a-hydroxytetrahydrobiopterin dehydratase|uniref:4a-hydroxytetrahydrobiopterin dehydratase n=1 Tax=Polynucleobacter sp. 30F-ANTBAC TaxID=2689095 RepID=UPI001C0E0BBB|nr:4a-hydroxytetrahydrobiopterin dehydratase [Polynucleobacter sp. 30F-ANTBAC]MBU3598904.1 4a-hydroxytetrahydrobiopterin dehydratase [Polynucleobacter sp. 30F-ANTBAC]